MFLSVLLLQDLHQLRILLKKRGIFLQNIVDHLVLALGLPHFVTGLPYVGVLPGLG